MKYQPLINNPNELEALFKSQSPKIDQILTRLGSALDDLNSIRSTLSKGIDSKLQLVVDIAWMNKADLLLSSESTELQKLEVLNTFYEYDSGKQQGSQNDMNKILNFSNDIAKEKNLDRKVYDLKMEVVEEIINQLSKSTIYDKQAINGGNNILKINYNNLIDASAEDKELLRELESLILIEGDSRSASITSAKDRDTNNKIVTIRNQIPAHLLKGYESAMYCNKFIKGQSILGNLYMLQKVMNKTPNVFQHSKPQLNTFKKIFPHTKANRSAQPTSDEPALIELSRVLEADNSEGNIATIVELCTTFEGDANCLEKLSTVFNNGTDTIEQNSQYAFDLTAVSAYYGDVTAAHNMNRRLARGERVSTEVISSMDSLESGLDFREWLKESGAIEKKAITKTVANIKNNFNA